MSYKGSSSGIYTFCTRTIKNTWFHSRRDSLLATSPASGATDLTEINSAGSHFYICPVAPKLVSNGNTEAGRRVSSVCHLWWAQRSGLGNHGDKRRPRSLIHPSLPPSFPYPTGIYSAAICSPTNTHKCRQNALKQTDEWVGMWGRKIKVGEIEWGRRWKFGPRSWRYHQNHNPSTAAARAETSSPIVFGFFYFLSCVCDVVQPGTSPLRNIHKWLMQQKLFPPRGLSVQDNDMWKHLTNSLVPN